MCLIGSTLFSWVFLLSIILIIFDEANSQQCNATYGNPPARPTGSLYGYNGMVQVCQSMSGNSILLYFTDSNGEPRCACLHITPSSQRLPLLVWLQPSIVLPSALFSTNLTVEASTAKLTNTSTGPTGYHLLLPSARVTTNFYCTTNCLAWDTGYRNFNRSDPTLNVDVKTIDYFIDKTRNYVNFSNVFFSGWSNGASMALLYALYTSNISAAAVYSTPDPAKNDKDPCPQTLYPPYFTPILDMVNQCDYGDICPSAISFITDLKNRYTPTAEVVTIIHGLYPPATTTPTACSSYCVPGTGLSNHNRWPVRLNNQIFFDFFRKHP